MKKNISPSIVNNKKQTFIYALSSQCRVEFGLKKKRNNNSEYSRGCKFYNTLLFYADQFLFFSFHYNIV